MRPGETAPAAPVAPDDGRPPESGGGILEDYGRKMAEKAFRLGNDAISQPPTTEELIKAATTIEGAIDIQVHRFAGKLEVLHVQNGYPTIACRKGCSYCCGTRIMASIPEIFRLAEWIGENFSERELAELRERLSAFREKIVALHESGEARPPIDCPILVDHSCSAHPGRPIACRGANSMDVDACIRGRENWQDPTLQIPLLGQPFVAGRSMVNGLRAATREKGLDSPTVEMPLALEIVLNDATAADRYLAGENVFEIAIVPEAS